MIGLHMNRVALNLFAVASVGLASLDAQQVTPPVVVPAVPAAAAAAAPVPDPNALKWNTESIEYNPKPGEESAPFVFYVTNTSAAVAVGVDAALALVAAVVASVAVVAASVAAAHSVPLH